MYLNTGKCKIVHQNRTCIQPAFPAYLFDSIYREAKSTIRKSLKFWSRKSIVTFRVFFVFVHYLCSRRKVLGNTYDPVFIHVHLIYKQTVTSGYAYISYPFFSKSQEYDEPHVLLQRPDTYLYRLVESSGSQSSARLRMLAEEVRT
jgi:hypothetical protein